jgi:very-short-patch-repair endonuclease
VAEKIDTVERILERLASRAHGVVGRGELVGAGVSDDEIGHRVRIGALTRVHRGVYRVGHRAPSVGARYAAAVKACGEGAVLSGMAAAYLFGLIKGLAPPPEVTAPRAKQVRGVRTRRSRQVEMTTHRRIPVTTVPRTLVDIAGELPEEDLARACHEAGVRYRTTPRQVVPLLARRPRTPGAAKLRRIISGDNPILLSKLEKRFRKLLRQAGLPLPETNRRAGRYYVDCRWPKHTLTVELDSYTFHNSRHSWVHDHRREREAYARGDRFRRYMWDDVFRWPEQMLAELTALLAK